MNRKEITRFLSELLVKKRLSGMVNTMRVRSLWIGTLAK